MYLTDPAVQQANIPQTKDIHQLQVEHAKCDGCAHCIPDYFRSKPSVIHVW